MSDPASSTDQPRRYAHLPRPDQEPTLSDARPPSSERDVILFVSSNGAGVGHLMRLMAMARRASPRIQPLFVTMSQAVPVVNEMGFVAEYVPSQSHMGMPTHRWHELLRTRLEEIVDTHQPIGLVFDGTWPYRGLLQIKQTHRDLPLIWSRRGMWRPATRTDALETSPWFDLIIEPGDFADEADVGPTSHRRQEVKKVGPILFLDEDELLPRDVAKEALGLDPDRSAALVQLGAGNINDVASVTGMVVRALAEEPSVQAALAESAISSTMALELDVKRFSVYPLARYLRAFDFAVAAAGYNTFHELVGFGVPTIFIPNLETRADDQGTRADHADVTGVGLSLRNPDPTAIGMAVQEMLDPAARTRMVERGRELFPENGAPRAMSYVEEVCLRATAESVVTVDSSRPVQERPAVLSIHVSRRAAEASDLPRYAPRRLVHGISWRMNALSERLTRWIEGRGHEALLTRIRRLYRSLPEPAKHPLRPLARSVSEHTRWRRRPPRIMFVLDAETSVNDVDAESLLGTFDPERPAEMILVTFHQEFSDVRRLGLRFESLLTEEKWRRISGGRTWTEYIRTRLTTLTRIHRPDHVIYLSANVDPDAVSGVMGALTEPSD